MLLQNNGSDDLLVTNEVAFLFTVSIDDEQACDVSTSNQPNDPI